MIAKNPAKASERERREAELVARVFDAECEEESLIAAALAAGQDVVRRRQADARGSRGCAAHCLRHYLCAACAGGNFR